MGNSTHFEDVGLFMKTFGQDVHTEFFTPHVSVLKLRLSLILEEFTELFCSVVDAQEEGSEPYKIFKALEDIDDRISELSDNHFALDHIGACDALTDLEYVVLGAGHAIGTNQDKAFDEVQRSNMSKLGEDGKPIYREDGKVMKGPGYTPPDLRKALGVDS